MAMANDMAGKDLVDKMAGKDTAGKARYGGKKYGGTRKNWREGSSTSRTTS